MTSPSTLQNTLFYSIISGNFESTNHPNWIKFLDPQIITNTFKDLKNLGINKLNLEQLTHFINFFNAYLDHKGVLDNKNLKSLFLTFHKAILIFTPPTQGIFNQDELVGIASLTQLIRSISKSIPRFSAEFPTHDYTIILRQFSFLLESLIKFRNNKINDFLPHFLEATKLSIQDSIVLKSGYSEITSILVSLMQACIAQSDVWDVIPNLNESFETLGIMARSVPNGADIIFKEALSLKNAAAKRIPPEILGHAAWYYFYAYYAGTEISGTAIHIKCKELFNLSDCSMLPFNPQTPLASTNTLSSTVKKPLFSTEESWNNSNITLSLSTHSEETDTSRSPFNSHHGMAIKLYSAVGMGALAGTIDGVFDILLHIAERKNCSVSTRKYIQLALTFVNSFAKASLPVLYSMLVDHLAEEGDPLTISQKISSTLTIFLLNILLQTSSNYLASKFSKESILRVFTKFLPLFAYLGMGMLANGEETVLEGLTLAAASMCAAAVPKAIVNGTIFFAQRLSSKKRGSTSTDGIPLLDVSISNNGNSQTWNIIDSSSSSSISTPLYFVTKENFHKIIEQIALMKDGLSAVHKHYIESKQAYENAKKNSPEVDSNCMIQSMISKLDVKIRLINQEINLLSSYQALLMDKQHETACHSFGNAKELVKNRAVNGLLALFKDIRTLLNNLGGTLKKVTGTDILNPDIQDKFNDIFSHLAPTKSSITGILSCYDAKQQGVTAESSLQIKLCK